MRVGRVVRGLGLALAASLWAGLAVVGCSRDDGTKPDAGVSPFDPRFRASEKTALPDGLNLPGRPVLEKGASSAASGESPRGSSTLDTSFGANEVEKTLRTAMRAARNGEFDEAGQLLDRVLAAEPINREALKSRGMLAFEQWRKGKAPEARTAAIEKAVELTRALRRAYDPLTTLEDQYIGAVLYSYCQHLAQEKRFGEATKALDEASAVGAEAYFTVDIDDKLAELRKSPEYAAALKAHDSVRLAEASARVKSNLGKPVGIPFNFVLKDLNDKPAALSDYKGKVVLLDFWGTWCAPCRQLIPGLIALDRNRKSKGLEVIGVNYEKDVTDESKARATVRAYVKEMGMKYTCLLGDEKTFRQIPDFKGFPTTILIDRAGRVRALILENDATTPGLIRDIVEVLLDEPPPAAEAPAAKKPAADTKKAAAETKKAAAEPKKSAPAAAPVAEPKKAAPAKS